MPKYRFEEIAYNSTEKKIPSEDDKHTYIGLEHLDSGTMTVTRWGSEVAPIGEKLVMRKGDVLFGKRRAYQKKVAIAPFDGIFSAHGMVLRPKEKAVTKEFFPLFISSDYFLNEAIRISVGSLSPTINWRDLKELEFSLPTIEEQSRISPLIWAAIRAKEAYKKMLESTDNLVKSQFIGQFGPGSNYPAETLDNNVEEMFIGPFGSSLKNECFVPREEGFCIVYEQKHAIQKTMDLDARYVTEKKYKELQRFNVIGGDIIVSCRGTIGEIYPVPDDAPLGIMHPSIMKIRLKKEKYDKDFFAFALERYMKEHMSEANGTAVKMAVSAKALGKEHFIIPDLRTQQAFVAFVKQSDKSKFELQQSITRIDNLIKSLIQGTEN